MNESSKHQAVNEALGFPLADAFEKDISEFMEAGVTEKNMIVALIDMDKFLRINDDFGRDAGDQALIDTGRYLASDLPEGAKIYRIAGDEFGIVFSGDMEKEDVFLLMEKKRAEYPVKAPDGDEMTISIGIAAAFDDASRYHELFRKAESAMFRVKYMGGNKVALAKEEKMVPKTSHYTADELKRLTKLSKREGGGEALLLREALDMLLQKYEN